MSNATSPRGQHDLGEVLERELANRAKFVPGCDPQQYTTNVSYRVLVKDCEALTAAEKKEMSDGLIAAGERSAGAICELNKTCPKASLLGYRFISIECENRLWDVHVQWTFKCVA